MQFHYECSGSHSDAGVQSRSVSQSTFATAHGDAQGHLNATERAPSPRANISRLPTSFPTGGGGGSHHHSHGERRTCSPSSTMPRISSSAVVHANGMPSVIAVHQHLLSPRVNRRHASGSQGCSAMYPPVSSPGSESSMAGFAAPVDDEGAARPLEIDLESVDTGIATQSPYHPVHIKHRTVCLYYPKMVDNRQYSVTRTGPWSKNNDDHTSHLVPVFKSRQVFGIFHLAHVMNSIYPVLQEVTRDEERKEFWRQATY